MRRTAEQDGRAGIELMLAGLALCALAVPLAWAGEVTRRPEAAHALGVRVLERTLRAPAGELARYAPGRPAADHVVVLREAEAAGLQVRLWVDRAVAWVDVMDASRLRAGADPLVALLAHARRSHAPSPPAGL